MIEVSALRKRYGDGTIALNGVSFKLDKKITSIIGRNGAGKTTLLRILSTQMLPTSGKASINGLDIVKDAQSIRKIAVSIPQESKPIDYLTAMDDVRLYLSARGVGLREARAAAEKALKKVGLWEARDKLSYELSGGMKRKIFVAMAIAADAEIVFLDEPTTGLDPFSRVEVWSAIRAIKGQVILTTHYMEEAQALSEDVLMIDSGKIFAHSTVEQLLKPFNGLVRIESQRKRKSSYKVGTTWISYVKKGEAKGFVGKDDIIKPVTLDDLFIKRGVNLES
ncbi:MAG TPA: ABC transporter ATP-binding protein [Candidatus Acidoferrum sp.]|nr:ABC transporter ATP-binding protein [Candidatus Acidoferrum sp.]